MYQVHERGVRGFGFSTAVQRGAQAREERREQWEATRTEKAELAEFQSVALEQGDQILENLEAGRIDGMKIRDRLESGEIDSLQEALKEEIVARVDPAKVEGRKVSDFEARKSSAADWVRENVRAREALRERSQVKSMDRGEVERQAGDQIKE